MTNKREDFFKSVWRKCLAAIFAAGVFSLFVNVLQLTLPLYMMQVFDRVLTSGSLDTLIWLSVIVGLALLAMSALDMVRGRILSRAGTWFEGKLSKPAFSAVVASMLERRQPPSDPSRELAGIRGFLSNPAVFSLLDAPWVPVYLVIVFMLHPVLGVVATIGAVVLLLLAVVNEVLTRRPTAEAGVSQREASQRLSAALRHPEALDAMGMLPGMMNRWSAVVDRGLDRQEAASDRGNLISAFSKLARLGVQMGVLGFGAWLVLRGELSAGAMIAGSILMSRALAPVEQAIGTWRGLISAQQSMARLRTLFRTAPDREGGMRLPEPKGELTVENVTLSLPTISRPILRNVSLAVTPGEAIAVTGPSAAGKSALARLLVGTWSPTGGAVRLDGADVRHWNKAQLGAAIGYLPQDIELYSGTVRENIARLASDADPAAVVRAARLADVHDMILRLPNGYDTEIGEGGFTLSGGQRQRIALARAFYGNPKLIVLDEPDSNLDREGEEALVRAVGNMKREGTSIVVIAHRTRILQVVDKVLVLRAGEVQMFEPAARAVGRMSTTIQRGTATPGGNPANDPAVTAVRAS